MDALVIGKPNVGKSLFVLNFASYLGLREIRLDVMSSDDRVSVRRVSLEDAKRKLVSHTAHKTLLPRRVDLVLPNGKNPKHLSIIDTVGISEGIHHVADVRQAMASTLARISSADMVLHLVDVSRLGHKSIEAPGPVDEEIARYAKLLGPYAILANKVDKPGAADGVHQLREQFRGIPVIPISALTRRGFREVKALIFRYMG
ncbi:GTPase [Sulfobacillus sp. hq2]|uniref:GTPase n=1 Tax=Sulfobacillus sp. hq2 TaxID=2039167 RepID=UPI000CCFE97A|nr:GTPase [Sulfobacillus sp. hq2]MCY0909569.1 50S ribosome-binding GTPase [Sulfobacillus thermotolerans]POB11537.1 GTP-binding protein [Sulfobacillus sp. hq2]